MLKLSFKSWFSLQLQSLLIRVDGFFSTFNYEETSFEFVILI